MMSTSASHPFDDAITLTLDDDGAWRAHAAKAYWNMVGPFGGISAATALHAVMIQPNRQGEPLAMTVNYAAPIAAGPIRIKPQLLRTNRTTQHWWLQMLQTDSNTGREASVLLAQLVTGVRRPVWSAPALQAPGAPAVDTLVSRKPRQGIEWFERYDIRFVDNPFKAADPDAPVLAYVRDDPPRALDFPSLAAICDTFFPSIFAKRREVVPIATVSMNIYFHLNAAELAAIGAAHLLGSTRSSVYHEGFFDAEAQVWSGPRLIATTQQVVWYKQ